MNRLPPHPWLFITIGTRCSALAPRGRKTVQQTWTGVVVPRLLRVHDVPLAVPGWPASLDGPGVVFRAAAPVAGSAVCNVVQLQSYRVLYPLEGLSATSGIYAVVSNLGAAAMAAAGSIFSQIYLPKIYNSRGAYTGRYIRLAMALSLLVLIAGLLFSGSLVRLLTKEEYLPYALAIGFGVISEAGNLIIGAVTVHLMLHNAARKLLLANVVSAAFSLSGFFLVMHLRPTDPLAIGIPLACSQLLIAGILIALASRYSVVASRH